MAFPLAITLACKRIDSLINSPDVVYCKDRIRRMRVERIIRIKIITHFLLKHVTMQHNGILLFITNLNRGHHMTIDYISKNTHIHERNVERCLYDLKISGLLDIKKDSYNQTIRAFTKEFWDKLRLWEVFLKDVYRAQTEPKIILLTRRPQKV